MKTLLVAVAVLGVLMSIPAQAGRDDWDSRGRYSDRYSERGGGGDRVRPRWNRSGSAVCPDDYDYVGGWCQAREDYRQDYRPRRRRGQRREYYGGGERPVRPQWNSSGSAVCPDWYDYVDGWCRPRSINRLPPRWNAQGSAVCPSRYDYLGGWCVPQ